VDQRHRNLEDAVVDLRRWKEDHSEAAEQAKQDIFSRITVIETKLWAFTALGAFVGAGLANAIGWILKQI